MPTLPDDLSVILDRHRRWLSREGGEQADFSDAVFSWSRMPRALLNHAIFHRATLTGSDFRNAQLDQASFAHAELYGSNFTKASLRGTQFRFADLGLCNFTNADLRGADLSQARFRANTVLTFANMEGTKLPGGVPVVRYLDARILSAISSDLRQLQTQTNHERHPWGVSHSRAGWAVVLAGEAGFNLEATVGTDIAAALIYAASRPTMAIPHFGASKTQVLADLRRCAAETVAVSYPGLPSSLWNAASPPL